MFASPDNSSKRPMRIAIVGSRGIPARCGVAETLAEEIARRLSVQGVEVTVFCEATQGGRAVRLGRIRLEYVRLMSGGPLGRLLYEVASLVRARKNFDVVYMLGYGSSLACWVPRLWGRKVWVNMGGLEWKRSKWGFLVRLWLKIMEGIACRAAHRIVFDNQALADEVQARCKPKAQVSVLAYGAHTVTKATDIEPLRAHGLEAGRYMLMVCRFEPENHVLEIVRAAAKRETGAPLIVVANSRADTAWQKEVMAHAGPMVRFLGPVYDQEVLLALRFHCKVYLHGHSVGGTNPSLLEAMGCGSLVLAHDNPFNREVLGSMGRYFMDEADLENKLVAAEDTPDRQRQMIGDGARDRVMNYYVWDQVATGYLNLMAQEMSRPATASEVSLHGASS